MVSNQARVEQMAMRMPQMHTKKTRQNVEEYIEDVMKYKRAEPMRRETAMTPNYAVRDYSSNSGVSKPVEDVAIDNAEVDMIMQNKWRRLRAALDALIPEEMKLLELRYLGKEDLYDYEVACDMGISTRTYKRVKSRAIVNVAMRMNLDVWFYPQKRS